MTAAPSYRVWGLPGIPEVAPGDDLAKLIADAAAEPGLPALEDGDILLVTSKIVSKAEGRILRADDREAAIDAETVRLVARRGTLRIVENRLGMVMAAAGVDASNTPAGTVLLLPEDPDASAARIRAGLRDALGVDVAVVVTVDRPGRVGERVPDARPATVLGDRPLDLVRRRRHPPHEALGEPAHAGLDGLARDTHPLTAPCMMPPTMWRPRRPNTTSTGTVP